MSLYCTHIDFSSVCFLRNQPNSNTYSVIYGIIYTKEHLIKNIIVKLFADC